MEENIEDKKENQGNQDKINEAYNIENKDCLNEDNNLEKKCNYNLDVEEDEINKEDIKDIVDYLSNLDYEKYSRDMEIKEALMILKTKMDKINEEKEKEKESENEKVKIIKDNNLTIYNNDHNNENDNEKKEENINEQKNNIITDEKEKENTNILNNNIKEPKEIIDEEELKKKEKIEKYKLAEKISKSSQLKDVHSVQSVQKLLLRENYDDQAPLRITIIKENPLASCDGYVANKLPFLHSLPLV